MSKKQPPKARTGPQPRPVPPARKSMKDPFASHRETNMRIQHFTFEAGVFDNQNRDHQVALETILVLNHGMVLEQEFSYRGSVFTGSVEAEQLELHWLALLQADPNSGRLSFQLFPCQSEIAISQREFVSRIRSIRTGHEDNPASWNAAQQARWQIAAKLVADWQMPISMITLATCDQPDPTNLNLRLFVPHEPEMIYNTMALRAWRLAIDSA